MPAALRPGEEIVVTALPLYHIFALIVNFITPFSIGAENWLVPNPRDMAGFVETLKQARPCRKDPQGSVHAHLGLSGIIRTRRRAVRLLR
jgi:acyl-CoA synthetase (AMP-forming)/AMP-acid ligase II